MRWILTEAFVELLGAAVGLGLAALLAVAGAWWVVAVVVGLWAVGYFVVMPRLRPRRERLGVRARRAMGAGPTVTPGSPAR